MINKKRLINTFLEIVQIDSPSGRETDMVEVVCQKLNALGLKPVQDNYGNVVVKHGQEENSILLTAHLDTVEPGRGIKPIIKNGKIQSSGQTILGADNKVAVAVILETIETLIENKLKTPTLEIVFTLSEEVANLGAVNLDYSILSSRMGFSFDAGMPLGTIVTASPFYNRFDLEILGKAAHASVPEEAVNVLEVFCSAFSNTEIGRVEEDVVANIGVIEMGQVRNTIPGKMLIKGEVRSYNEKKLENTTNKIIEAFRLTAKESQAKVNVDKVRENGGFELLEDDSLVDYAKGILSNLGIVPVLHKSTGCYDANVFIDRGIKILNLGDGSGRNHTTEEFVYKKDLVKLGQVCLELVLNWEQ